MSKTVDEAIRDLVQEITADEAQLQKKKETVNTLCGVVGRTPLYALASERAVSAGPIRSDQFYGQPLAASVREILNMRKAANLGAASINEIHAALMEGGYRFDTKNDDVARKSLRNSLAKNNTMFHKLPNGRFGLSSWYPKVRESQRIGVNGSPSEDDSVEESEAAGDTAARLLTHQPTEDQ